MAPPAGGKRARASASSWFQANTTVLSMKLLIDTKAQRVLFAEAGKDVVNFLFSLFALPVSTVFKLAWKDSIVGSIGNLYTSVEELDDTGVLSVAEHSARRLLDHTDANSSYDDLEGIVMYAVMDDLTVRTMSPISSITLLNTMAVTDIGALQEKTVQVGQNEFLAILKASLQSKTALTDVFLSNEKKAGVVNID